MSVGGWLVSLTQINFPQAHILRKVYIFSRRNMLDVTATRDNLLILVLWKYSVM